MPAPASQIALEGLRDLTTLKWYVIPLLAIVFSLLCGHHYVLSLKSHRAKIVAVSSLYAIAVLMNVFGMGTMGWIY